ncbi:hypothetical protein ABT294_40165 [Nonomuraea sp. NPDC000554]|uniref:hypothetical protein n=1 Tax=Nonomuraea sp. NPDC000554 TaxID=3154259 RepID=UPI0033325F22
MQYRSLRPSQVKLDPQNPRLPDGTTSDREAINRLLDDGAEALVNLARDLAKTGESNPSELPIVIRSGSKYLVVEGNRRFAALKLLKDPALADREIHQKAFKRAAGLGPPPSTIYVVVAPSREVADRWIVLRHTGENNGVGTKRWNAENTANHRRRNNAAIDSGTLRALAIADELLDAYPSDSEIVELVLKVRREKLTNIGRFFALDVMALLHLTLETDETNAAHGRALWAQHDAAQLREFFLWALTYIDMNSVDAYKNPGKRKEAIKSVAHLVPGLADAMDEPRRLADSKRERDHDSREVPVDPATEQTGDDETPQPSQGTETEGGKGEAGSNERQDILPKPKPSTNRPEQYLLQGLKLPNHPERIRQLLRECQNLEIEKAPGIACVVIRVLVELSVTTPGALALTSAEERDSLKDKIMRALEHLDPYITRQGKRDLELAAAYLEASDLGLEYLNGFVHNPSLTPDPHLARRFSKAFRPLLERMDAKL